MTDLERKLYQSLMSCVMLIQAREVVIQDEDGVNRWEDPLVDKIMNQASLAMIAYQLAVASTTVIDRPVPGSTPLFNPDGEPG